MCFEHISKSFSLAMFSFQGSIRDKTESMRIKTEDGSQSADNDDEWRFSF